MRNAPRFYARWRRSRPAAPSLPPGGVRSTIRAGFGMEPSMAGTRPADEVDERLQRYVCAVESGGRPERELESAAAGLDPPSSQRLRERVYEFHRLGALLDRREGD